MTTYIINAKLKSQVYARDGRVCQYCGTTEAAVYEIEHIIPLALHGPSELYNLTVACRACNQRKGDTIWEPRNLDTITQDFPEWAARVRGTVTDPLPPADRLKVSIALTERGQFLLDVLATKRGLNKSQVMETLIREAHRRELE
jgi:hypothetical protein